MRKSPIVPGTPNRVRKLSSSRPSPTELSLIRAPIARSAVIVWSRKLMMRRSGNCATSSLKCSIVPSR